MQHLHFSAVEAVFLWLTRQHAPNHGDQTDGERPGQQHLAMTIGPQQDVIKTGGKQPRKSATKPFGTDYSNMCSLDGSE